MKHFFFLLLITISSSAFSQKIFNVYDGFTLELLDSVDVSCKKRKVEISSVARGIYTTLNTENETELVFAKQGYKTQLFYCSDDRDSSHTIILAPTETLLESYRAGLPYYGTATSAEDNGIMETDADPLPTDTIEGKPIFMIIDDPASFPGGIKALYEYLIENIKYPTQASDLEIGGKVFVQFVISTNGSVSRVKIVRGVNLPLDAEAFRVVQSMPNWTPGRIEGKPVNCYFNLPIVFKLQ